jgi:hypothetical protein
VATPTSGATGNCNINVTNLLIPLTVECQTGASGAANAVGIGGNSGDVRGAASSVGTAPAGPGSPAISAVGSAAATAIEGTQGNCSFLGSNAFAALSVNCATGAVGSAEAGASGGTPGPTTGAAPPGGVTNSTTTGSGGSATTSVLTGPTGNCVINLVNIHAALTVICVTGGSGSAQGAAAGGRSGTSTLLTPGSGGFSASGGAANVALSGSGGNAVAVISSGSTGTCVIVLVNVMAQVSVLCITGNSGNASGVATGGASGAALLLASGPGPGAGAAVGAGSGSGGDGTALATSGNTGNCAVSLTNTFGSISLQCRTGNSGSAEGLAVGGDSGPAIALLRPSSIPSPATSPASSSPFAVPTSGPQTVSVASGEPAAPAAVLRMDGAQGSLAQRIAGILRPRTLAGPVGGPPMEAAAGLVRADRVLAAFQPATGLGATVPMSLAAGLMLSGGAAAATTRRRRLARS